MQNSEQNWVAITGISAGFGQSLAKTFATSDYNILGIARSDTVSNPTRQIVESAGKSYEHLQVDVSDSLAFQAKMDAFLKSHRLAGAIHNVHHLLIDEFEEISADHFEQCWRASALGGFNLAKATVPHLQDKGGTLIFSGATASLKAGSKFAAFASAKFAQRALAQSLMRAYAKDKIHVVHTILDGLIWSPQTTERFSPNQDDCIDPDALAEAYLSIFNQPQSAWTNEIDFRPFSEKF